MTTPKTELTESERPFLDQLRGLGWRVAEGSRKNPAPSFRETFSEVYLRPRLADALRRINLDEQGQPWLDEGRVLQAISALEKATSPRLIEANEATTKLLHEGVAVEGLDGKNTTLRYIDWEQPENNDFLAINQFRLDEPGGQAKAYILPDIVLFVNGIPLVVVECKSPHIAEPIAQALDQLRRYAGLREEYERPEGNPRLFFPNQLLVTTCFDDARLGTISAGSEHFLRWKDTSPVPLAQACEELGKTQLSPQEMLVSGVLRPAHLLDIVRHFVLFMTPGGRTIKIAPRYQQFRGVQAAVHRLKSGKTRLEDGAHDRRGGIVWHTQGSGKSLSMVFLVKKLRSDPDLRRMKVVFVTDRLDLERQLRDTATLTGETVQTAGTRKRLKELLRQPGPGILFATIQKWSEEKLDQSEWGLDGGIPTAQADRAAEEAAEYEPGGEPEPFPTLNESEDILVLVDEAHRSHGSALHANLLAALPNAARIGFTGTPIIMRAKKKTHEIFGDFLDRYTIKESEADGSTVPILYEGRTADGAIKEGGDLDQLFENMFRDRTPEELEAIKRKYATKGHVMEAPALIQAKARNMLRHFVDCVMPNGFKAQLVAVSRRACVRYHEALKAAQAELLAELEGLPDGVLEADDERLAKLDPKTQYLARAWRRRERIAELEFAPVFSGDNNDPPDWAEWTDRAKQEARIARFKKPLVHQDPKKRDPLAFLIVKSMLLTGFDAPIEQVMYLDRHIQQHELLQAIARVNRTGHGKRVGLVVDYYGVARHLKEALAAYSDEDVEGTMSDFRDLLPLLRDRHERVLQVFTSRGVNLESDAEALLEVLRDEKVRAEFGVKLKGFLQTLDDVMPRPEALPYLPDAKELRKLQIRAANRYRDPGLDVPDVGHKVRQLIDEHVVSLGMSTKIEPVEITDADFEKEVERQVGPRAKASEMEHALRYHITKHFEEDPEHYERLSERLKAILKAFQDRWEDLVAALREFAAEARQGREDDDTGLDPETQAPFLGLLKQALVGDGELTPEQQQVLVGFTVEMVEHIRQEIALKAFWSRTTAQDTLKGWLVRQLDDLDLYDYDALGGLADRLVELARANHHKLVG